jgi:GMP synthase (glutamine-hydrolysing)
VSRVCVLIHADPETPGLIAESLARRGIELETIRGYAGESIPKGMKGRDALLVMGGPMGVYEQERYPFLRGEIDLIRDALKAGKPVLGVCLGSQLLATALGAKVAPARKEIGWFPVTLSDAAASDPLWPGVDRTFVPFHWHGDAFEIPAGGVSLASSGITPFQAFRHGRNTYGLLFHLEVNEGMLRGMLAHFGDELPKAGASREQILAQAPGAVREMSRIGNLVFDRWAARIGSREA